MAQEVEHSLETLTSTLNRLAGVTSLLEQTVTRLEEKHAAISGQVQKIVATVEESAEIERTESERLCELERKLREAMSQITEMRAQGSIAAGSGRKTVTSATVSLLAKQGISNLDSIEAGSLDVALSALSVEQRIAVKSQLLRAGLLG